MKGLMKDMRGLILFILTIIFIAAGGFPLMAQKINAAREGEPDFQLPDEVKPFVEAGTKAVAYAESDLNGDGTLDYIVVLEKLKTPEEASYADTTDRPTLIIVRDENKKLSLAARNERVVFCATCAGGMGDAFDDITIKRGGFSVTNRGGNRERWIVIYEFKYSRRDNKWQLARVVDMNYDSTDPNPVYKKTYTPPKHFGKIDFADFDPENFKGKGKKSASGNKTREVKIYLYQEKEIKQLRTPYLVEVKRRVDAAAPLTETIRALLAGATSEEEKNGVGLSFIYGVNLESVQIKNRTARVDFEFDTRTNSWLDPTMEALFNEAMEKTATQFTGVERVLVCVDGIENFFLRKDLHRKCPKNWARAKK
jgi:hypothetical protein